MNDVCIGGRHSCVLGAHSAVDIIVWRINGQHSYPDFFASVRNACVVVASYILRSFME